ncbi:MAG: 30S ribosomal protein S4 [Bdellovibrionales bacterium]|nr:30S ribosomal protein S4 [Bdellovibrionales bacterium]
MWRKTVAKAKKFKIQRKLGVELPGLGKPGALERKPYPPGQHGTKRKKYSDYAIQLEEKQKIRNNYGMGERQLRRFIGNAKKGSSQNWVETLVGLLERRLDNVVFRLGFAPSIRSARQLCSHGHVFVNGKKVNIGSAVLKVGDKVTLSKAMYENQIYMTAKQSPRIQLADHLEVQDGEVATGIVKDLPKLDAVPFPFQPGLFSEYYAMRKA